LTDGKDLIDKDREILLHLSGNSGMCEFDKEGKVVKGRRVFLSL